MKHILKILIASSFFINLSAGLLGPIYAIFVEEIGGDLLTAGTAYAVFSIATGVLIFFLGKWEDQLKHQEKILIIGRILMVIGTAGYLIVDNSAKLFAVQIILGISEALIMPAYSSLFSKNLTKGKFASQWGYWDSLIYITIGISAILGSWIASTYGFQTLFIVMTIASIFSLLSTLFLIKRFDDFFKKKRVKKEEILR